MFNKKLDGTYEIDTKIKVNGVFKHFHKGGYATLSAAKADFEKAKYQFIMEHTEHHKANTFGELFEEYKKQRSLLVDRSTVLNDESIRRIYFGMFSDSMIKDVFNEKALRYWYEGVINDTEHSNTRKSRVITRMKDLLKFAYQRKYIDASVFQDCDVILIQVKHNTKVLKERIAWSLEEEGAFLNACKENEKDYLMFKVFVALGARLGEFLALMPKCIDFEKNRITICQQVKNVTDQGGQVLTDKLKTIDSYRSVLINKDLMSEIKDYIETICIEDNDFLFFSFNKSEPMGRETFRRKLRHYCKKAGIREINPHCIRHTMATRLAALCHNATDIEAAAKMLGHSTAMFMQTYANHNTEVAEKNLCSKLWAR